ncbi:unnamed protein product [Arabidopsis halleri]
MIVDRRPLVSIDTTQGPAKVSTIYSFKARRINLT